MYWLFFKAPGQLLYMEISFNDFIADQITQFDLFIYSMAETYIIIPE